MAEQSLCDGIDLKWMYEGNSDEEDDTDSSPTKIHEKMSTRARLRRILLRTTKSRIISTFFDIVVKGLCCLLYFVRVQLDHVQTYECNGHPCHNNTEPILPIANENDGMVFSSSEINW